MLNYIMQFLFYIYNNKCSYYSRPSNEYKYRFINYGNGGGLKGHVLNHSHCFYKCIEFMDIKTGIQLCLISGWRLFLYTLTVILATYITIKIIRLKIFLNRKRLKKE
ncbi:hypothetical protein H311_00195 [Anncaliia algerae PRA109]|nr:hypothetical protein H311_00195 [Anncaliia algerae PRA109]